MDARQDVENPGSNTETDNQSSHRSCPSLTKMATVALTMGACVFGLAYFIADAEGMSRSNSLLVATAVGLIATFGTFQTIYTIYSRMARPFNFFPEVSQEDTQTTHLLSAPLGFPPMLRPRGGTNS